MPATHHLLNATNIELLKPGCIVINTSRGAVVDTAAVAAALEAGALWGAGIDVFEEEPLPADDPLVKAPHALLTPHAAYWSEEAGLELRTRMTQNAIDVVLGREPHDCPEQAGVREREVEEAFGCEVSADSESPNTSQTAPLGAASTKR